MNFLWLLALLQISDSSYRYCLNFVLYGNFKFLYFFCLSLSETPLHFIIFQRYLILCFFFGLLLPFNLYFFFCFPSLCCFSDIILTLEKTRELLFFCCFLNFFFLNSLFHLLILWFVFYACFLGFFIWNTFY